MLLLVVLLLIICIILYLLFYVKHRTSMNNHNSCTTRWMITSSTISTSTCTHYTTPRFTTAALVCLVVQTISTKIHITRLYRMCTQNHHGCFGMSCCSNTFYKDSNNEILSYVYIKYFFNNLRFWYTCNNKIQMKCPLQRFES